MLRPPTPTVYRYRVSVSGGVGGGAIAWLAPIVSCTTIDPGPDYVVATETFDADFFYCHVEPQFIFQNNCGPGDPTLDPPNGCHFNPSAVSGMALLNHPAVDCGGGDHPVDTSQTGTGSPAAGNLEAVSLEMNSDPTQAPLYVRPSGNNHPRAIFPPGDPAVLELLNAWATK
jgi:hypothetical protein